MSSYLMGSRPSKRQAGFVTQTEPVVSLGIFWRPRKQPAWGRGCARVVHGSERTVCPRAFYAGFVVPFFVQSVRGLPERLARRQRHRTGRDVFVCENMTIRSQMGPASSSRHDPRVLVGTHTHQALPSVCFPCTPQTGCRTGKSVIGGLRGRPRL